MLVHCCMAQRCVWCGRKGDQRRTCSSRSAHRPNARHTDRVRTLHPDPGTLATAATVYVARLLKLDPVSTSTCTNHELHGTGCEPSGELAVRCTCSGHLLTYRMMIPTARMNRPQRPQAKLMHRTAHSRIALTLARASPCRRWAARELQRQQLCERLHPSKLSCSWAASGQEQAPAV